ncbi:MAG: glycosyltransferase [Candidatus Lernaella stagnicola]|nr:glycosyltransferase [Candidatus Lernaella stagnicola]
MKIYAGFDLPRQILMFSTADWDAPLWTNKQQVASRLAKYFDIIYVEPLAAVGAGQRKLLGGDSYTADCGVTVYRPPAAAPFGNKIWSVNRANIAYASRGVKSIMREKGFSRPIFWCYPPTAQPFLTQIDSAVSCYDCVDEYSAFPGAWAIVTRKMEQRLLKSVDAVFTTAQSLFEAKRPYNKHTYFVPNVADFGHFHKATTAKPIGRIRNIKRPVIGFVGAVNYKLDGELLATLFRLRPNWSFVFIGPDCGFGVDQLIRHRNAHFWGRKDIDELPAIMAGFDVCMIPYKLNRYIEGVLPLKFFEYLATGKPVVATKMAELEKYTPMVDLITTPEDFVNAVERRLADDPHREQRLALARANSWEHRIERMLTILENVYQEKREDHL